MMMLVRGRVVFFGEQGKPAIEWAQAHYPEMKKYSEGGRGAGVPLGAAAGAAAQGACWWLVACAGPCTAPGVHVAPCSAAASGRLGHSPPVPLPQATTTPSGWST
jgi:hypothetical protein